ncbi:MAG: 30S ribosome-binding factor RbfA [Calditrichaeota bacterium]|nr:30S ribosome-binding factor RbfA [Calditrichota bacterium]MCB9368350.1 30S ribosome-binding factor RbfA [Calditrichota bacterium]
MSNQLRQNSDGPRRPLRLAAELEREIPGMIRDIAIDMRSVLISVTGVTVTDDLSMAHVYFSIIGESASGIEIEHELNKHKGKFRTAIAKRFVMRQHPDVRFHFDETPAKAARIEELLKQVRGGEDQS